MIINNLLKKTKVIEIDGTKYSIEEQIGEGAFGYVYKVKDQNKKINYALKKLICQTNSQLDEAQKEIDLMNLFEHPNILNLVKYSIHQTKNEDIVEVLLLLPLYQQSLQNIIDSGPGFPECSFSNRRDVRHILGGCVKGIHQIHVAGYRHADIKPANVLLDCDMNPVITDFGSALPLRTEVTNRQQALAIQDNAASNTTASFRAPELFDTPSHCIVDGKSDVWGLGCTFFAALFSRTPFENPIEGLSVLAVMAGNFSFPPNNRWPPEYLTMISACLRPDTNQRLTIDDLALLVGMLPDPVEYQSINRITRDSSNNSSSNNNSSNNNNHNNSNHNSPSNTNNTNNNNQGGGSMSLESRISKVGLSPSLLKRFTSKDSNDYSSPNHTTTSTSTTSNNNNHNNTPETLPTPPSKTTNNNTNNTNDDSNFTSFADFEHFPEQTTTTPPFQAFQDDDNNQFNQQMLSSIGTTVQDFENASITTTTTTSKKTNVEKIDKIDNSQNNTTEKKLNNEEEEDEEDWNFQSYDDSTTVPIISTPTVPRPSSPIAKIALKSTDSTVIDQQESNDFEFGDFVQATESVNNNPTTSEMFPENSPKKYETKRVRLESSESVSSKIPNIEYSGHVYMMRTKRTLLSTQKIKKKLWLKLTGNQIEVFKTSEPDSKLHFLGKLTKNATSIRPINSNELGRHCLLFEGVEASIDKEDESERNTIEYSRNKQQQQQQSSSTNSTSSVTMEIGFETVDEMNHWLDLTLDLIN